MVKELTPAMIAAVIADGADEAGVTVQWFVQDPSRIEGLGLDPGVATPAVVGKAARLFHKAIDVVVGPYRRQRQAPGLPIVATPQYDGSVATALEAAETIPSKPHSEPRTCVRASWLGHSITSVLRRLGNEGMKFDDARVFCANMEVGAAKLADNTIRWQLREGRKGEMKMAELTPAQIKRAFELAE